MQLGAFSVSLAVKDLAVSVAFYEKLGFVPVADTAAHKFAILKNGSTVIGLFEGMFERNMLTFNPGWDHDAQPLADFDDVRDLHGQLRAAGLEPVQDAGLEGQGPGSFVVVDPDGNPVLIDQHVAKS